MQQDTSYLMENLELDYEQAYEIEEEERALLMLHHNLYHLTLEAKLRVFLLLFLIIFIPATIVFLTCYLRDRRLQRLHKIRMKTLLESGPDPSLPYSARLSRPVPVSVSNLSELEEVSTNVRKNESKINMMKIRKVSFASSLTKPRVGNKEDSFSSISSNNDDVFVVERTPSNEVICTRPTKHYTKRSSLSLSKI